jgi:phosphatidylethanolamine-binding protein (PEBP) family uncharacterized protein
MKLASPAFSPGGQIPSMYSRTSHGSRPPLVITDQPPNSWLSLLVYDPDAPDPESPKLIWSHEVLINVAPGASLNDDSGSGIHGKNSWQHRKYEGPQPPIGRHRYIFEVIATDEPFPLGPNATRKDIEAALKKGTPHEIARAELVGTFAKEDESPRNK